MLNALGLVADIVGTVLVGFVEPRHRALTADGGTAALNWRGAVAPPLGWALLVVGFGLQLGGALTHR